MARPMTEGTRMARAAAIRGKSMLQILIENARRLEQIAEQFQTVGETTSEIGARALLAQVADRAAKYLHSPQMAIKHEHTQVDGKPIRPVIEITGYPAPVPAPDTVPRVEQAQAQVDVPETKH
jgi:hypothetical protein